MWVTDWLFDSYSKDSGQHLLLQLGKANVVARLPFVEGRSTPDFKAGIRADNHAVAIKTGARRDFLDNSVVPYQTAEPKADLKTPEIAGNARAWTLLITCDMAQQAEKK